MWGIKKYVSSHPTIPIVINCACKSGKGTSTEFRTCPTIVKVKNTVNQVSNAILYRLGGAFWGHFGNSNQVSKPVSTCTASDSGISGLALSIHSHRTSDSNHSCKFLWWLRCKTIICSKFTLGCDHKILVSKCPSNVLTIGTMLCIYSSYLASRPGLIRWVITAVTWCSAPNWDRFVLTINVSLIQEL